MCNEHTRSVLTNAQVDKQWNSQCFCGWSNSITTATIMWYDVTFWLRTAWNNRVFRFLFFLFRLHFNFQSWLVHWIERLCMIFQWAEIYLIKSNSYFDLCFVDDIFGDNYEQHAKLLIETSQKINIFQYWICLSRTE